MGLVLMGYYTLGLNIEITVQDRHRMIDTYKIYFIDAYSLFVNSDLYLSRICFKFILKYGKGTAIFD